METTHAQLDRIKIGDLWTKPQGTTESYSFDYKVSLQDITFSDSLKANLLLMRMGNGISAILSNLNTEVKLTCNQCLSEYSCPINIDQTEREFIYDKEEGPYDEIENFLIDKKNLTIDISDMARQEIILHFPLIPVCSDGCKGLCIECGKNLNVEKQHPKTCGVKETIEPGMQKPFANLKKLLN